MDLYIVIGIALICFCFLLVDVIIQNQKKQIQLLEEIKDELENHFTNKENKH